MFFNKKNKTSNPKKSESLEKKGDQYLAKNNYKKAIEAYRNANELSPSNAALYQKLLDTQSKLDGEWNENDFVEAMDWTMKKQEIENPKIKNIHESLKPEYQRIKQLIGQMLTSLPELREPLIEKIKSAGVAAVLPLLDTLLVLDEIARESMEKKETPPADDSSITSYDDVEKE